MPRKGPFRKGVLRDDRANNIFDESLYTTVAMHDVCHEFLPRILPQLNINKGPSKKEILCPLLSVKKHYPGYSPIPYSFHTLQTSLQEEDNIYPGDQTGEFVMALIQLTTAVWKT